MRRRTTRGLTAGSAALGTIGAMLVLAGPAQACSCAGPDVDAALAAGQTLAIVTRTDTSANTTPDGKAPIARFRVEDSAGPRPPATLTGQMDTGSSCQPYVAPGAVAALVFGRKDGAWHLGACSEAALGPALHRVQGDPVAVKGGTAVAYAAGDFGGARVVALSKAGNTVAWGGGTGVGERVAVCPDRRTVVSVGRTPTKGFTVGKLELTVHDAGDLRVLRTVKLPSRSYAPTLALRCRDKAATKVDLVLRSWNDEPGRLVSVDGSKVTGRDLGLVEAAAAMKDGFLVAVGDRSTSIVEIRPGSTRTVATLAMATDGGDSGFALAPDEKTVALFGYRFGDAPNPVVTVDVRSGKQLGEWSTKQLYVTGLTWVGPDRLLLRREADYRKTPVPLLEFDRTLKRGKNWRPVADEWGGRLTSVGGAAVIFGSGSRLTAAGKTGPILVAESLRLAAAEHVVGVRGGRFAAPGRPVS